MNPTPAPVARPPSTDEGAHEFTYRSIGKRDPFNSGWPPLWCGPLSPDSKPEPLFGHDYSELTLTGVVSGRDAAVALVRNPNGTTAEAELGTLIGPNWGTLSRIEQDHIIIREEVYTDGSPPSEHEIRIDLASPR